MSQSHSAGKNLKDVDGNVFNVKKATINGMPPLKPGDCFFYRGKKSESAQVTKVRVAQVEGRLALLRVLSTSNEDEVGELWVDLTRVEVVQMQYPGPNQ